MPLRAWYEFEDCVGTNGYRSDTGGAAVLENGAISMTRVLIEAGSTVTKIEFFNASTLGSDFDHSWAAIFDGNYTGTMTRLAISADNALTIAGNPQWTAFEYTLTSAWTAPGELGTYGVFYVGHLPVIDDTAHAPGTAYDLLGLDPAAVGVHDRMNGADTDLGPPLWFYSTDELTSMPTTAAGYTQPATAPTDPYPYSSNFPAFRQIPWVRLIGTRPDPAPVSDPEVSPADITRFGRRDPLVAAEGLGFDAMTSPLIAADYPPRLWTPKRLSRAWVVAGQGSVPTKAPEGGGPRQAKAEFAWETLESPLPPRMADELAAGKFASSNRPVVVAGTR